MLGSSEDLNNSMCSHVVRLAVCPHVRFAQYPDHRSFLQRVSIVEIEILDANASGSDHRAMRLLRIL